MQLHPLPQPVPLAPVASPSSSHWSRVMRPVARLMRSATHANAERVQRRADAACALYRQSLDEYQQLANTLATISVSDLALAASNRGVTVGGYALTPADGAPVLEWAILHQEYARLNLERAERRARQHSARAERAVEWYYVWQVTCDRV